MTEPGDSRRALLKGAAALTFSPWLSRHALAADLPRFALGIASGQPHASGMVLWTKLTGAGLPPRVPVQWELARDEGIQSSATSRSSTKTSSSQPTGTA